MAFLKIVLYAVNSSYSLFFLAAIFMPQRSAVAIQEHKLSIAISTDCQRKGFCPIKPEGNDQLEEKFNNILTEALVQDYADRYGTENQMQPTKLSPKGDWDNCPYETKTDLINTYKYSRNKKKTVIIDQTELFKQCIKTVICANQHIQVDSEEQCFNNLFASGLSTFNMKSTCQTETARTILYVYDTKRSLNIQKFFYAPACCKRKVS